MRAERRGTRRFYVGLGMLLVVAAAGRAAYALTAAPEPNFLDDDGFFSITGENLAKGQGYVQPVPLTLRGESFPTAEHPPGYPVLLSVFARLADGDVDIQRMAGVLTGTLTVLAVALIARRLAGARAGLIAGVLCTAYPSFIAADGALMSESLFAMLVAFSLLQTRRLRENWTFGGGALLGLLLGLATLTRTEAVLLVPLLVLSLPCGTHLRASSVLFRAGVVALAALVVVAPWIARNWHVFGEPVLTNNVGTTLRGANCPTTYSNDVGGWSILCVNAAKRGLSPSLDEASTSAHLREAGLEFVRENPGRALIVAVVRVGRVWGVLQPQGQETVSGRPRGIQRAGVAVYYALVAAAVFGVAALRRHRAELLVLAMPLVVVTITAFLTWGLVRIRHQAEVTILVLAGVGLSRIVAASNLVGDRRRRRSGRHVTRGGAPRA